MLISKTKFITLTSIFQSEDNNTETESSPSGYETDSSSDEDFNDDNGSDEDDGDDDTDIDVVIDEYRSCSSLATISLSSVDQRGLERFYLLFLFDFKLRVKYFLLQSQQMSIFGEINKEYMYFGNINH